MAFCSLSSLLLGLLPKEPLRRRRREKAVPALAGLCGSAGETVLRWRAGCCGDSNRGSVKEEVTNDGVTRDPPGLLKGRAFWLVTGTVTGMAKLGAGTEDWREKGQESRLSPGSRGERLLCHQHLAGSAAQQQEAVGDFGFQGLPSQAHRDGLNQE